MSAHNMLEVTLNEILHVINPLRDDWETRMQIIDELRVVVSSMESLRGATVEPFGSFVSQLFTRWGDLDISIELSNGSYIATVAKKHKQTLLGELLRALRKTGGFKKMQFVHNARVPILKLESRYQNISCDISINNLSGHMKSKFLLWISLIDRRFRDMVLLVKEWAKANEINNPKTGTFNSYSLSLLVIFHFQTCVPAILPPLKDLYPGNMADELIGVRADVERRIDEVFVANVAKFRKERRVNHSSLSELFTSFLIKFSDISTWATDHGVCTFTGKWEAISSNTRWLPRTYALFIEDPFEQPENAARAVSSVQLTRIAEVFAHTYSRVVTQNQTRNALIPSLVRYEISQYFPGVAFRKPNPNGGAYSRTNQYAHRGTHSSSWKNQFQKPRQVSSHNANNVTAQQPRQASQGQARAVSQQLPTKNEPRSQPNKMTRQGDVVQASQANNVASQQPIKAPQGQAQQIWRPKQQFDK